MPSVYWCSREGVEQDSVGGACSQADIWMAKSCRAVEQDMLVAASWESFS